MTNTFFLGMGRKVEGVSRGVDAVLTGARR